MDVALLANQFINGIQLGLILFLLAAGLSLVFGIMDFINLAHGAFYMIGAYICATVAIWTNSYLIGFIAGLPIVFIAGFIIERYLARHLYKRTHLDHVLATFGLILCADAGVKFIWGPAGLSVPLPHWLEGKMALGEIVVPNFRAFVVVAALVMALALWAVVNRTRAGMLMRAAASNEPMARALGVETGIVFSLVFSIGAVLAGIAGMLVAPITGTSIGMGNQIVILALVVIIIGGIGSIRGAFIAALGVGLIDTLGRAYLSTLLALAVSPSMASAAGPAIASILIYLIMIVVLVVRPAGLFPPATR
jgi:branched-chain amino acid transport system permease protein